MHIVFLLFSATGMLICMASADSPQSMGGDNRIVTLHGGDWDSFKLINAITSYILRNGYGYTTKTIPESEKNIGESLSSGMVDVSLEVWKENHPPALQQHIDTGSILDLGRIYDHAAHTFVIPSHIAEQYNISTMEDMQRYWYLCKDPEDPSRGLFYNALITWLIHDANLIKLAAYGLTPYYHPVSMPSSRAYEAVFMKAAQENRTVFGMCWMPSAVMGTGYWKELKEPILPSCTDTQTQNGSAIGTNPPRICPLTNSDVHKLVSAKFGSRAPELIPFFTALRPDENIISSTLTYGYRHNISDWDQLAEVYLIRNEARWKTWVSSDAYERITKTLAVRPEIAG